MPAVSQAQRGLKGMLKEGGSKRREAAEQIIKGAGGRLEAKKGVACRGG
jgi:hypothetical protein